MKRLRWLFIAVLFVITFLTFLPTGIAQALMLRLSLQELALGADSIVIGTVIDKSSYWNAERTRIYTSVVLSIEENLKGVLGQDKIVITVEGGEVAGISQWVSDAPTFEINEKVVVFLKHLPEAKFEVYGSFQGQVCY